MQEFHMEILYHKGSDNVVADALSCIVHNMSFTVLESSLLQDIKEAQLEDLFAQQVRSAIDSAESISFVSPLHTHASSFNKFSVENGWVKRKGKIYVPSARDLRRKVLLQENHDSPCASHPGQDKIVQLVRLTFW